MLPDAILQSLKSMSDELGGQLWESVVEDRDQQSGASFIQVGVDGVDRQVDLYLSVDHKGADPALLDFVAAMRNSVPLLVSEIESSTSGIAFRGLSDDELEYLRRLGSEVEPPPWQLVEPSQDGHATAAINLRPGAAGPRLMKATRDFQEADLLLLQFLVGARNSLSELVDIVLKVRTR